jgi:hypothetical protein
LPEYGELPEAWLESEPMQYDFSVKIEHKQQVEAILQQQGFVLE